MTSNKEDEVGANNEQNDFELFCSENSNKGKRKSKNKSIDFSSGEVVYEKDIPESIRRGYFEKNTDKEDRVIRTSAHLSPYAFMLLKYLSKKNKTSNAVESLRFISSSIGLIDDLLLSRYNAIIELSLVGTTISAKSGESYIDMKKTEIYSGNKKLQTVNILLKSSSQTTVKKYSEGFDIRDSDIIELLLYMHFFTDKDNGYPEEIKSNCAFQVNVFTEKIDSIIEENTAFTKEDVDYMTWLAIKTKAAGVKERTQYINMGGESYVVKIAKK